MNRITDINIKNKKILIRVDYNVPIENSQIKNDFRLKSSFKTINYCLSQNCSVILISHLGRPKGKDKQYSLEPIIEYLEENFNTYIHYSNDCISNESITKSKSMLPGEIHLLENLRFYNQELDNNENFAKKLSKHADIYICDSFGIAHRKHASNSSILKFFTKKAIGFLMDKEIRYLSEHSKKTKDKCLVIVGGAKISSKINMISNYLDKASHILIGGAMAFTLLKAQGRNVGASLIEPNMVTKSKSIIDDAIKNNVKIVLPVDVVCSKDLKNVTKAEIKKIEDINKKDIGLDIGPETTLTYLNYLNDAKTVIWNGPMGLFENYNFATGTQTITSIIKDITANNNVCSIIGGGDTIRAIESTESLENFTHVSTGGGASLKLLSGEKLDFISSWEKYE